MDSLRTTLTSFLLHPHNKPLLSILKGARNGLVYGTKVRFPHALVMIFLFRSGTFREKLSLILTATRQHATNLGFFVTIYKSTLYFLNKTSSSPSSPSASSSNINPFLAGLLGGYLVFGRQNTNINQQIVLYVFARVTLALAKLSIDPNSKMGIVPNPNGVVEKNAWPVFAAISWGLVMWLFNHNPESLQSSLRSSMEYLYINSDVWDSWRNFLIHNV